MTAADVRAALDVPFHHGTAVDFRHCDVVDALDLSGLVLPGCDFTGARFSQLFDARGAIFKGLAWFRHAQFAASIGLNGALFESDGRFDDAVTAGAADFSHLECRGVLMLDRACFRSDLALASGVVFGNLSMADMHLGGRADLTGLTCFGGLWQAGAQFAERPLQADTEIFGRSLLT
ncbi:MAG: hypothetical protein KGQ37_06955 [Hyphomicrobiales bacterium]|nr:hypothetical protein [Hyphomicrobiales bacterium]